jgi:hypothetical protein
MSKAVAWSTDVRMMGNPIVTFTPLSEHQLQRNVSLVVIHAITRSNSRRFMRWKIVWGTGAGAPAPLVRRTRARLLQFPLVQTIHLHQHEVEARHNPPILTQLLERSNSIVNGSKCSFVTQSVPGAG